MCVNLKLDKSWMYDKSLLAFHKIPEIQPKQNILHQGAKKYQI